jgi:hypothetical protein
VAQVTLDLGGPVAKHPLRGIEQRLPIRSLLVARLLPEGDEVADETNNASVSPKHARSTAPGASPQVSGTNVMTPATKTQDKVGDSKTTTGGNITSFVT